MKKNRWRPIFFLLLLAFLAINGVSFMHAYRFTHVVLTGQKTSRPENLTLSEKLSVLLTGVKVPKSINTKTPEAYGYAYTPVTIYGNGAIETPVWEVAGQDARQTIILFHGFSSNKADLLPLANMFLRHEANLVLVDFPGHGDSPYSWTTLGHREAEVVKTVFDYYARRIQQPILLYGASLGASSIITAISRYQMRPDGIILDMPYSSLYETVKQRFKLMGFPISFPFAELLVFWGGIQHTYNAFALNPGQFARNIPCPVLLSGGARDQRVPAAALQRMAAAIPGQTTLHIFQTAGHESLFHASPEEYERVVTKFLAEAPFADN